MRTRRQPSAPTANTALRPGTPAAPGARSLSATGGRPIEPAVRGEMEHRFAQDFSNVRLHTESRAAQGLGAQAMTSGSDIAFAPQRYAPTTPAGRGLLAHELAHVVQQRQGAARREALSRPGDRDERGAHDAVRDLGQGRRPSLQPAASGVHRQPAGDAPLALPPLAQLGPRAQANASQPSSQEMIVESFLNQMWTAQSDRGKPFRLTAKVLEGLAFVFPLGAPLGVVTEYESTAPVLERLRPQLTSPIAPNVVRVLDRLPAQEKPLGQGQAEAGKPAAPQGTPPGDRLVQKPPAPGSDASEAMSKALAAAFETFRATKLGRELEKQAKEYVFSKEGIPLVILVTAAGLVFLAANDPKLPSIPEIPIGKGISLKVELSAKGSQVPGLLADLVHDRAEPAGTPERKVGVGATFTFEALGESAVAVGHFFAEAAAWIAKGVVHAGTAIGHGVKTAGSFLFDKAPELLFGAGGAALGAGIGALAGGGMGALIGAGVGLAVGVGAGLVKRFLGPKAQT